MTDVVYGVSGGMEDFAYGVAWENKVILYFITNFRLMKEKQI